MMPQAAALKGVKATADSVPTKSGKKWIVVFVINTSLCQGRAGYAD
jgi:hypothetical protein